MKNCWNFHPSIQFYWSLCQFVSNLEMNPQHREIYLLQECMILVTSFHENLSFPHFYASLAPPAFSKLKIQLSDSGNFCDFRKCIALILLFWDAYKYIFQKGSLKCCGQNTIDLYTIDFALHASKVTEYNRLSKYISVVFPPPPTTDYTLAYVIFPPSQ